MFEWLRNLLPHHSQGSSMERWSQSVLRPQGFWTPPFILNNSVETAAPFHDIVSREINLWKSFDLLWGSNPWPLAPSAGCLTARPPELTDNQYLMVMDYIAATVHTKYITHKITPSEPFTTIVTAGSQYCTDTVHHQNNGDYCASRNICNLTNWMNWNFVTDTYMAKYTNGEISPAKVLHSCRKVFYWMLRFK